jgi:predicted nucleotidyltransferase
MKKHFFAVEGDFIETKDGIIFDVKGFLHPADRIIAYIRYIPLFFLLDKFKVKNELKEKIEFWIKKKEFKNILELLKIELNISAEDIRTRFDNKLFLKFYDLKERFNILSKIQPNYLYNNPNYDFSLQAVPNKDIKEIFKPEKYLKNLLAKEGIKGERERIIRILSDIICQRAKISSSKMGITGSTMINLENRRGGPSDLDLIVYGEEEGKKVHKFLQKFLNRSKIFPFSINGFSIEIYNEKTLKDHFKFRAKGFDISYKNFVKSEMRKKHQFFINKFEVYIRFLRFGRKSNPFKGIFEKTRFQTLGKIKLKGKIVEDEGAIFTPSIYQAKIDEIIELSLANNADPQKVYSLLTPSPIQIFSLRGRFAEHAKKGENIYINGKLERVSDINHESDENDSYLRIIIGDKTDQFYLVNND